MPDEIGLEVDEFLENRNSPTSIYVLVWTEAYEGDTVLGTYATEDAAGAAGAEMDGYPNTWIKPFGHTAESGFDTIECYLDGAAEMPWNRI